MSLRTDRTRPESYAVGTLLLDAECHRIHGWDMSTWLELCCLRNERVRRVVSLCDVERLVARHWRDLPMVAAFTFGAYCERN